jgi:DNA-binding response OmpR family regulator
MNFSRPSYKARYLRFSGFTMDLVERLVTDGVGAQVLLTSMDFNLLRFFA